MADAARRVLLLGRPCLVAPTPRASRGRRVRKDALGNLEGESGLPPAAAAGLTGGGFGGRAPLQGRPPVTWTISPARFAARRQANPGAR